MKGASRLLNLVAVVGIWMVVCPAHALALTPPVVDSSALPTPAPPGPPVPTTQREGCAIGSVRPSPAGSDPLRGLDFAALWQFSRGEGQRVAVIDTGISRHPRLAHLEPAGDYVSSGDGTQDCDGHGTVVAGIIAATPDPTHQTQFAGIAPAATLLAIRQSSSRFGPADYPGAGGFGDVDTLAAAVRTAADLGATVINISSIACAVGPLDDAALGAALAYAVDVKDAVVVTAAGNTGGGGQCPRQSSPETTWDSATVAVSPAWYDEYVLAVGSVDDDGAPSSFSLPGPWVDVAAPGENMVSLDSGGDGLVDELPMFGRSAPISGTSYAAPVVSGLAALIRAHSPELTARQVMNRIESTARRPVGGRNPSIGNGVIDPRAALGADAAAASPGPQPPGTPGPPAPRGHLTAMVGSGVCAAAVTLTMAALSSTARGRADRRPADPTDRAGGLDGHRGP